MIDNSPGEAISAAIERDGGSVFISTIVIDNYIFVFEASGGPKGVVC